MKKIYSWSAKRSGGRITITGKDQAGNPVKVANVDLIGLTRVGRDGPSVTARDKDGASYSLELAAA